ncbi:hypothetical protein OESDEN_06965 [Oesophagostomum dentatum]|uniref:UNC-45/Cro1/She4 central domain-containing protein n=1 Tax=Oesophagostomum dentatum TaxID=61180 RepID=A0A0B1TAL2_OESDE|nr:hypothetical protein OESDEN_06965 [Oesophagostomum dentatum]
MVTQSQIDSAESLKDAGNDAAKRGEWTEASEYEDDKALRGALYRNRALARLKQDDYEGTESDATKALEYDGADVKALYRRALAREHLDNVAAAFKDAKEALRLSPKDKSISDLLQRLVVANNEKVKKATSMDNKVKDMSSLAFEGSAKDAEQKKQAFNNLLVLARETEAGAARIWNVGKGVPILLSVAENNNEPLEISIAAVRILDETLKNHGRALFFLSMHDSDGLRSARRVCRLMCARDSKEYVDAAGLILQRIFNALVKMDRTKDIKPDPEVAEANKLWIIRVILELESMLTDKTVSAIVREMVIDILLKNLMHMDGGIPRGWSWKFTEDSGLLALLDVSSQIPEQCDYPVTHETRQHVAICLQRLDEDMVFDSKRLIYKEKVDHFFNGLMARASDDPEGHKVRIKLACFLITMLQGPVDVGINLVTNDQVTALMLQMAASSNLLMQSVAAELIVMTVVKHERATSILKVGIPILRKLYESEDENVKVRALMGLCKCAAAGGDDASRATMKEGAPQKLAQTCKKFLLDYEKYSIDVRRFACEGLSYLSLDADVKEWIVSDSLLLRALFCLAQSAGALCVFTLATIYVNLANAYEKPQVDEELVKLAQASMSDSVRRRIIKERAVPKIEEFWFMTDHEQLRAAAAELLLNLLFLDEFFKDTVRKGTDKLKLWVLYAAEANERLARSASAAFAILTEDVDANRRIFDELKSWPDVFKEIAMHEDPEAQRRGLMGIANIMESDEKLCAEIVASEIFRVLVAIEKLGAKNEARKGATEQAVRALAAAEKFGLIKPTDRELYERTNQVSTIPEE